MQLELFPPSCRQLLDKKEGAVFFSEFGVFCCEGGVGNKQRWKLKSKHTLSKQMANYKVELVFLSLSPDLMFSSLLLSQFCFFNFFCLSVFVCVCLISVSNFSSIARPFRPIDISFSVCVPLLFLFLLLLVFYFGNANLKLIFSCFGRQSVANCSMCVGVVLGRKTTAKELLILAIAAAVDGH